MTDIDSKKPDPPTPLWARPAVVALAVIAFTVLKALVSTHLDFLGDEAYYTYWAMFPLEGGYYDHPPAVAAFIKIGTAIFGDTAFASRFTTLLSTLLVSAAMWRTGMLLFADQRATALAIYWFNLTLGGALGLMVVTPDAPSMLFWMLALWAAAELHHSNKGAWWLAFGLFAGLGLTAKYTGLFLGAGIVLWLVWYAPLRRWFASPWLYVGGVLAMVVASPVLFWNIANDFISFRFQLGRSTGIADGRFPDIVGFLGFGASQAALMLPALALLSAIVLIAFFAVGRLRHHERLGLLILTTAPSLVYFYFHSLHSHPEGNWTWPVYAPLCLAAAWMALEWRPQSPRLQSVIDWSRRTQLPFSAFIMAIIFAQGVFAFADQKAGDRTRLMHGWSDVAAQVEEIAKAQGIATVGVGSDYSLLGWLATYGRFGGHDYRILPVADFHRYGFVPRPSDDAVEWPILVARKRPIERGLPDTITIAGTEARQVGEITRDWRPGSPEDLIGLYKLDRPAEGLFGAGHQP